RRSKPSAWPCAMCCPCTWESRTTRWRWWRSWGPHSGASPSSTSTPAASGWPTPSPRTTLCRSACCSGPGTGCASPAPAPPCSPRHWPWRRWRSGPIPPPPSISWSGSPARAEEEDRMLNHKKKLALEELHSLLVGWSTGVPGRARRFQALRAYLDRQVTTALARWWLPGLGEDELAALRQQVERLGELAPPLAALI